MLIGYDKYFKIFIFRKKENVIKRIDVIKSRHANQSFIHYKLHNNDFHITEKDIEAILSLAINDKNIFTLEILEECENDLQEKYKIHLTANTFASNFISGLHFLISAMILLTVYPIFLSLKLSNIVNIDRQTIIKESLTFSPLIALIAGVIVLFLKLWFEYCKSLSNVSAYEYCIKLLKNAKVRANSMNSIMIIHPYKSDGMWVFDDRNTGLIQEPFVSGADKIIDRIVTQIADAESGFSLIFAGMPFPSYQLKLDWRREEYGGNWYYSADLDSEGWLCPALFKYFESTPKEIYAQFKAKE